MQGPAPLILKTPGFSHYGMAWSPFYPNRMALASSANYGLVGNGRLHLASLNGSQIALDNQYDTQDGLYDVAWSEIHENQIITCSGDGTIKLWDLTINNSPIRAWREHSREVYSVDWSNLEKQLFVSASWDGLIKMWTPERPQSVVTLQAHQTCVYQALFSPHMPSVVASCSTDSTVKIFDLRSPQPTFTAGPQAPATPALTIPAHGNEVLTIDWNKYRPWTIASAGVDRIIKIWDCRMVARTGGINPTEVLENGAVGGTCENNLGGHEYAVRKIQWSPHRPDILASASYDMSCRIWTSAPQPPTRPSLLNIHDTHTEFVVGCAWSIFEEGVIASCSWDHSMHVYRPGF